MLRGNASPFNRRSVTSNDETYKKNVAIDLPRPKPKNQAINPTDGSKQSREDQKKMSILKEEMNQLKTK